MPEVESVAAAPSRRTAATRGTRTSSVGGRRYRYGASAGTDDLATAHGRRGSRGAAGSPRKTMAPRGSRVVINERLAREMFPDKDPVGQFVAEESAAATRQAVGPHAHRRRHPRIPKGRRVRRARELPVQPCRGSTMPAARWRRSGRSGDPGAAGHDGGVRGAGGDAAARRPRPTGRSRRSRSAVARHGAAGSGSLHWLPPASCRSSCWSWSPWG